MVYYRKYRPQTIAELDSSSLRENLTSVLTDSDLVAHAFLFTGPKGLGKTSTARIVAKSINCTGKGKKSAEPCNKCDVCLSITNGTNMDVIEIDAASNRGIDEIRDLKEKVKLSPLSAHKKVYIIDEVHMLTTEAFNALLKTLEEPPEHVVFVLCTTEPQKVPATILSRCSHIMFLPATNEELVRSFERIAKGEGIKIKKEVLSMIAELSDSGFRDGVKILEELVMGAQGKEITVELIEEKYKVSSISYQVEEISKAMSLQDTKAAIGIVERLSTQGVDIKYFLLCLIKRLHAELLSVVGVEGKVRLGESESNFSSVELQYLLEELGKAGNDMRFAVIPEIPLELSIVEWGSVSRNHSEITSQQKISAEPLRNNQSAEDKRGEIKEEAVEDLAVSTQGVTLKTMRKNLGTMAKIKALYGEEALKNGEETSEEIKTTGVSLLHYDTNIDTKEWMAELWKNIISEMKTHNHTVAGVLRGCYLKSYDKKSVIIEALYKFHKEKLDEGKNMDVLVKICRQLTGNEVMVKIELRVKS